MTSPVLSPDYTRFVSRLRTLSAGKLKVNCLAGGESDPNRPVEVREVRIQLSDEKAADLKRVFEEENFFGIDPYDQCTRPPIFEFDVYDQHFSSMPASNTEDGALWVFEGWNHGKSRILQRLNPGYDDPVRRLGILLMNESKLLARK